MSILIAFDSNLARERGLIDGRAAAGPRSPRFVPLTFSLIPFFTDLITICVYVFARALHKLQEPFRNISDITAAN